MANATLTNKPVTGNAVTERRLDELKAKGADQSLLIFLLVSAAFGALIGAMFGWTMIVHAVAISTATKVMAVLSGAGAGSYLGALTGAGVDIIAHGSLE